MNIDKVIVSSRGALTHNHGSASFKKDQTALAGLVEPTKNAACALPSCSSTSC
jgi:hypothetical protein